MSQENNPKKTPLAHRRWERLTPKQRWSRHLLLLGSALALVICMRNVDVISEFLYDAPAQMVDLLRRMVPVDWAYYPTGIHTALVDTIHIATLGTMLSILMSLPVALLVAKNITRSRFLNWLGMLILVSSRSVNVLVWALLFVAVFGPGPLAGTITIAVRSIGFVGKLFGEALEECHPGPVEALQAAGAPWRSVFIKGYWPQVLPAYWAIALFRWDINIRESSVIGLVGAGGIGMALDHAQNLFQWERVSLILVCIFALVVVCEVVVTHIRKQII